MCVCVLCSWIDYCIYVMHKIMNFIFQVENNTSVGNTTRVITIEKDVCTYNVTFIYLYTYMGKTSSAVCSKQPPGKHQVFWVNAKVSRFAVNIIFCCIHLLIQQKNIWLFFQRR